MPGVVHAESALDQLKYVEKESSAAAKEPSEGAARARAGNGFDSRGSSSGDAVDLRGKRGVVDPNDLKQYDPPARSLRTTPPPVP